MNAPRVHQYFGPSPRHDRACVELRFAVGEATYRLAPLEPALLAAGFKVREVLPDEPLPLDAAICRLASVMLARHKSWWSRHGASDGVGWAAIEFPVPSVAVASLETAYAWLAGGEALAQTVDRNLRSFATWLNATSKYRIWTLGAAQALGRDAITLVDSSEVYQVGHGAKGVHCYRLGTERDAITGQKLEEIKLTTVQLLRRLGLPTTTPVLVKRLEEIDDAISRVGLPCVVKPLNLLKGEGVAPGLTSKAEVVAAVERVLRGSDLGAQIENHVEGHGHRMFVVAHELLWAYRRTPTSVVGDGTATVGELIGRENRRRAAMLGGESDSYLEQIKIDQVLHRLLADRHGLEFGSVLEAGRSIQVVAQANIMQGGVQHDVTGEVHPDNRELVTKVSRLFRLRSIGIDFITPDISRSWKEVPCAIIEVNRLPGCEGVGDVMFAHRTLFPNRRSGAIPTVAVIGDEGYRAAVVETALTAFARAGLRAGQATFSANAQPRTAQTPGAPAVETLMLDPDLEAAVVACAPEEVEHAGFPLRRCDLLIRQDKAPLPWLEGTAETVRRGTVAPAKIHQAIAKLARRNADPAEGGPLPVIEPVEGTKGEFKVKVWRARSMPRAWFWEQVGAKAPRTTGLTTHEDLLGAVLALGKASLGSGAKLAREFAHEEPIGPWERVTFEAALALPKARADEARAALLAAVERVNAIAAMKID
jgi:D-alanine-D-alanine ligase-like ATP-grasp enzyme